MSQPPPQEDRLEKLELKVMDLENTIQQLNDVVLQHYQDLESLRRQINRLHDRLNSPDTPGPRPSATDELPPHY